MPLLPPPVPTTRPRPIRVLPLLAACVALAAAPAALEAQLTVQVREQSTDDPIPGATVTLSPGGAQRTTDEEGTARFDRLYGGSYGVQVTHWAYRPEAAPAVLGESDFLVLPLELAVRAPAEFLPGLVLRLSAPAAFPGTLQGETRGMVGDTLLLAVAGAPGPLRIPTPAIRVLAVRDRVPQTLTGATWGLLLGAAAGAGLGHLAHLCVPGRPCSGPAEVVVGGIGGAAVGSVVGALLGRFHLHRERWLTLPWPAGS